MQNSKSLCPRHLYFSQKAADQYGYLTAHFPNGETVNFTGNYREEDAHHYKWEDKKLVGIYPESVMATARFVENKK